MTIMRINVLSAKGFVEVTCIFHQKQGVKPWSHALVRGLVPYGRCGLSGFVEGHGEERSEA